MNGRGKSTADLRGFGRTCLITGANGAIGPAVINAFRQSGFRVRAFSRRADPKKLPDDVECYCGEIVDPSALARAAAGADIVIHLAALLHIVHPSPALSAEYWRVNVEGTRAVVAAALDADVRRVVVASTIAVYGSSRHVLDEESSVHPDTPYGATKLEAEQIARAAKRRDGVPLCVVLRCAAVYGPGVKGNYRRLVTALARRTFLQIGSGATRRTLVYERDVARAMLIAATHPTAAGRVYNLTDGQTHQLREIIAAISSALGRRPPRVRIPVAAARAAALTADALSVLAGRRPQYKALLDKYLEDVVVDGTRIQRELGFLPAYALEEGWREAIAGLRDR